MHKTYLALFCLSAFQFRKRTVMGLTNLMNTLIVLLHDCLHLQFRRRLIVWFVGREYIWLPGNILHIHLSVSAINITHGYFTRARGVNFIWNHIVSNKICTLHISTIFKVLVVLFLTRTVLLCKIDLIVKQEIFLSELLT